MKKIKYVLIILIILILAGLAKINLNLNRQIYSTIIEGTCEDKISHVSEANSWNLDHMERILTTHHRDKIKDDDMAKIPKIRILYNSTPFDFRIDTDRYVIFINNKVFPNLVNKFEGLINNLSSNILKVFKSF